MKNTQLILLSLIFTLSGFEAAASTILKQIKVVQDDQIVMLFDQTLSTDQIKTEYFRDIVQLTFSQATVYPAKVISSNGQELKKVFAYQFTPQTIRTRLTVEGDAEKFRERLVMDVQGKMLTIKIRPAALPTTVTEKQKPVLPIKDQTISSQSSAQPVSKVSKEQSLLLKKVMAAESQSLKSSPPKGLTEGKEYDQQMQIFGWLALAIGLLGLIFFAVRRLKNSNRSGSKGITSSIRGFLNKKGLVLPEQKIEVVANHYLGPKKSIAIVKVMGRNLVVGVTEGHINLITQIENQLAAEQQPAVIAPQEFEDTLMKVEVEPAPQIQTQSTAVRTVQDRKLSQQSTVRDGIRKRMEAMKAL